jgi:hypothetical protein
MDQHGESQGTIPCPSCFRWEPGACLCCYGTGRVSAVFLDWIADDEREEAEVAASGGSAHTPSPQDSWYGARDTRKAVYRDA